MFGLIWRVLPGPGFVKFLLSFALVGAAAGFLWFYAFPWVDPYLPFNDVTVEAPEGAEPAAPGGGDPTGEEGEQPVPVPEGEGDPDEGIVGVDVPIE